MRQHHIQGYDRRRRERRQELFGGVAVGRLVDFEAIALEDELHDIGELFIVLDDQCGGSHQARHSSFGIGRNYLRERLASRTSSSLSSRQFGTSAARLACK